MSTASEIRTLVDEQAEDDALWFVAQTVTEAYLQQELRRLHAIIEATQEPTEDELRRMFAVAWMDGYTAAKAGRPCEIGDDEIDQQLATWLPVEADRAE